MGEIIIDGKKLPRVAAFDRYDLALVKNLNKVFVEHGLKGRIISVEFGCGTLPPKPPIQPPLCYRVCVLGPDDGPICRWECH